MEPISLVIFGIIIFLIYWFYGSSDGNSGGSASRSAGSARATGGGNQERLYPDLSKFQSSLYKMFGPRGGNHPEKILDRFSTLDEVTDAVRLAGLESCGLIFGIDFTASNITQGIRTHGGRSLHHLDMLNPNPYQKVISILGETLEPFDDDGNIPSFGFGDITTRDTAVFPFRTEELDLKQSLRPEETQLGSYLAVKLIERNEEGYCRGFHDVLEAYNQIAAHIRLSGPTNFAPLIYQAIDIVKKTRQYHILVIVADGQVTSERATKDAIVEAAKWPLSIVMIGVGDGPWEMMADFDDSLPTRKFDNFQFVDFHAIMSSARNPHAAFALYTLMEIPDQYKKIRQLGLVNF